MQDNLLHFCSKQTPYLTPVPFTPSLVQITISQPLAHQLPWSSRLLWILPQLPSGVSRETAKQHPRGGLWESWGQTQPLSSPHLPQNSLPSREAHTLLMLSIRAMTLNWGLCASLRVPVSTTPSPKMNKEGETVHNLGRYKGILAHAFSVERLHRKGHHQRINILGGRWQCCVPAGRAAGWGERS